MSTVPSDFESFSKRAAGRYRYNKLRQFHAAMRLVKVVELLKELGLGRGNQSRIAERIGVHRSTICRDMAKLERGVWGGREAEKKHLATSPDAATCPSREQGRAGVRGEYVGGRGRRVANACPHAGPLASHIRHFLEPASPTPALAR